MDLPVPKLEDTNVSDQSNMWYVLTDGDFSKVETLMERTQIELLEYLVLKETEKLNEMIDNLASLEKQKPIN